MLLAHAHMPTHAHTHMTTILHIILDYWSIFFNDIHVAQIMDSLFRNSFLFQLPLIFILK